MLKASYNLFNEIIHPNKVLAEFDRGVSMDGDCNVLCMNLLIIYSVLDSLSHVLAEIMQTFVLVKLCAMT